MRPLLAVRRVRALHSRDQPRLVLQPHLRRKRRLILPHLDLVLQVLTAVRTGRISNRRVLARRTLDLLPRAPPRGRGPRESPFLPPPPPRPDLPVGARILHFAEAWESITQDQWVLQIVREGYVIPFRHKPPLSLSPIPFTSGHPALPQAIQALLEKGAVERVLQPDSPGFYSRIFLVPKKTGGWRPVIDLSTLNSYIDVRSFKMETMASIRASIQPCHWGVSLDLTDAYFHVPIHPRSRKYLRFSHGSEVFQFRALPFGISTAPQVFTRLMGVVGAHLRLRGSVLLQYFDDWLLHQLDRRRLLLDLERSWLEILSLGLLLNPQKSELVPSQNFTFVGMNFLTAEGRIRIPPSRAASLINLVQTFCAQSKVRARAFLSLLGVLNAAADLVELGRLHLRPLQFYLLSLWRPNRDSLLDWIPVGQSLLPHLQWWLDLARLQAGVSLTPPKPALQLITDASHSGWGAHLEPLGFMTSGTWSLPDSQLHINNLEMRAARLALEGFQEHVLGQTVLLSTDNTTVVAYVKRQGGTHSLTLFQETRLLFTLCQELRVTLVAKHIPGRLNVLADSLSRRGQLLPSEWSLHQEVANLIFSELGHPMVDLFATRLNHRLPLYVSPVLDPGAWALDALTLDWDQLIAYAFPPFNLLPRVLQKVRTSCCQLLLVAPWWPQRAWFSNLMELLCDHPRALPHRPDLLSQRGVIHNNPDMFHLHVWPLSGEPSRRNAFLLGLPSSLSQLADSPLGQSTMPNGRFSLSGVCAGRLIRSIPLLGD